MKIAVVLLVALHMAGSAICQESLPAGTMPLVGEITLRFVPTFESRCTIKQTEKGPSDVFATRKTSRVNLRVFDEAGGRVKLSIAGQEKGTNFLLQGELDADSVGMKVDDSDAYVDGKLFIGNQSETTAVKRFLGSLLKVATGQGMGVPLRQGTKVVSLSSEICNLMPNVRFDSMSDRVEVAGLSLVNGRESVVFNSEELLSCSISDKRISILIEGWKAIDRLSGLPVRLSSHSTMSITGVSGVFTNTDEHECLISGSPTRSITPSADIAVPKSAEQRLVELKALLDKGLISRELYDSKRAEILRSL